MAITNQLPVLQPSPFSTWFWVSRGIIFFISITGNGLVVYLILTRSRLIRVISNWFVLSLAIADLLVTFVTLPEIVYAFVLDNTYPWALKVAYDVCLTASVFNLCALTFERFIAVVHPLKYSYLISNHRLVVLMLVVVWMASFLSPWPYYICYRLEKFQAFRTLQVVYLFICELLPTIVLGLAFIKMLLVVRKQEMLIRAQIRQVRYNHGKVFVQKNRIDKRNRSIIELIGAILLIYTLCYTLSFFKGLKNYVLFEEVANWFVTAARLLYQVNSAFNGYVYALMKNDIKKEVKILIFKKERVGCRVNTNN